MMPRPTAEVLRIYWGGQSDLASVHDEKTMQFLVSLAMTKKHKEWKSRGASAFWIGLCKTRGSWQWTDNTPFCYNNWATGQPTNGRLAYDELFVEFYLVSLTSILQNVLSYSHLFNQAFDYWGNFNAGKWNDNRQIRKKSFICQHSGATYDIQHTFFLTLKVSSSTY